MGNVASWSGTKTLTCFEYYDQAIANFFNPGENRFHSHISVNWASIQNTSMGPTIDPPTCRGPYTNIEKEGYPSQNDFFPFSNEPFSGKAIYQIFLIYLKYIYVFRFPQLQN